MNTVADIFVLILFVRYGCGNSIHIKCMKIWAEHQKSSGESIVKCPFCRVDFGSFEVGEPRYYLQQPIQNLSLF